MLRLLVVEDSDADAEFLLRELQGAGFGVDFERVETAEAMTSALSRHAWDLVVADHRLPYFSGAAALELARRHSPDVPFLLFSGSIGEETAVEMLKSGADDYVMKDRIARLVPAVERALRAATERNEHRQAEQRLRDSELRFRSLAQSANDAIVVADRRGTLAFWNRGAERMFGYRDAEVLGQPLEVLLTERDRVLHRCQLEQLLATGQSDLVGRPVEVDGRKKDGTEFPIELSLTTWQAPSGLTVGGFIRDLSERRRADEQRARLEDQLRQSQKLEAVGQLAGGIAHDFNNLLTVVLGCCDLALSELNDSSPALSLVEEIRTSAQRAAALTGQLLAFSRRCVLVPEVVDLNGIVSRMEPMLRRLIGEDIEFVTALDSTLVPVKIDASQWEQVIMNLVVNARDAMPQGGLLRIETSNVRLGPNGSADSCLTSPGPYARMAVSDTGCGMDRATMARIFEPFFTTKPPRSGTGLGLSTVHGIVRQSGGHIEVHSAPGQGSTFEIYLPKVEEVAMESATPYTSDQATRGDETILLVEDDDSVRILAQLTLRRQGYNVLSARNAVEATHLCAEHPGPIHLMLTDVVMPGMSGQRLGESVGKVRPGMRILFMSGHMDDTIARHGLVEPGAAFLHKPFTPDSLTQMVRQVLDREPLAARS
jgi:hypothetical protein